LWPASEIRPRLFAHQPATNSTTTNAITVQFLGLCDTFDVYYTISAGASGTFQITRTGDASSPTLSCNGPADAIGKFTFSGALGTTPLVITRTGGTAVNIIGVDGYNSAKPSVSFFNLGWSAGRTADWIDTSRGWSSANFVKALGLDAMFIQPGINDYKTGVSAAQMLANLESLYSITGVEMIPETHFPSQQSNLCDDGTTPMSMALQEQYVAQVYQFASNHGWSVLDHFHKIGSQEFAIGIGRYSNALHPIGEQYRMAAEAGAAFLYAVAA